MGPSRTFSSCPKGQLGRVQAGRPTGNISVPEQDQMKTPATVAMAVRSAATPVRMPGSVEKKLCFGSVVVAGRASRLLLPAGIMLHRSGGFKLAAAAGHGYQLTSLVEDLNDLKPQQLVGFELHQYVDHAIGRVRGTAG